MDNNGKIIGLGYYVSQDSNACALDSEGNVLFASGEERYTRIKKDNSYPKNALNCIRSKYPEISKISAPYFCAHNNPVEINRMNALKKYGVNYFTGHHESHAACAYYASGFRNCAVFTYDGGMGNERFLSTLSEGKSGEIIPLFRSGAQHDIFKNAWKYGAITKLLGFTPNRHEGKITGLSCYGKYNENLAKKLRVLTQNPAAQQKEFVDRLILNCTPLLTKYKREDISYAIQYLL